MKRAISVFIAAALGTTGLFACECGWVGADGKLSSDPPPLTSEELTSYRAIFTGQVVGIRMEKERNPSADEYLFGDLVVELEVSRAWKGVSTPFYKIHTPGQGPACGFDFELGGIYLVFAKPEQGGAFDVTRCSRTELLASGKHDLATVKAALGPGVRPE